MVYLIYQIERGIKMYIVMHNDRIVYKANSIQKCRIYLYKEIEKNNLQFWQEQNQSTRIDFIFYKSDNENILELYTILKV